MADNNSDDLISGIPEIDPNKFRLQCKKLMLTYKGHLVKNEYIKWLNLKRELVHCWIAHETGDTHNPYEHSHILLEFKEAPNWTGPRCLDFCDVHPNIKKVITKKHWENCVTYMVKEDKSNTILNEIAEKISGVADWVWKSTDLADALRKCVTVNDALGIKLLYDNKPLEEYKSDFVPKQDWQLHLLEDLKNEPDPRKIIWYQDSIGDTGKSQMAAYLEDHCGALVFRQFGGAKDVATIMQNALKNGWNGNTIVVDLPRNAKMKSIYEPLEGLKDGRMTALKYNGGFLKWPRPHVIVFANFWPNFEAMSMDRWVKRDITKKSQVLTSENSSTQITGGIRSDDLSLSGQSQTDMAVSLNNLFSMNGQFF